MQSILFVSLFNPVTDKPYEPFKKVSLSTRTAKTADKKLTAGESASVQGQILHNHKKVGLPLVVTRLLYMET